MMYQELVRDFARRTRMNLEAIRQLKEEAEVCSVYEVTQLVNSMLGLLVFPHEEYMNHIPATAIEDLQAEGWPVPEVFGDFEQADDLRHLIRRMRNGIAHCNLEFSPGHGNEISGIVIWNEQEKKVTWRARLSVFDLDGFASRFIEILLGPDPSARLGIQK